MNLTEYQQRAIQHTGGNLQLIACAGSGKTEVVAQRVVHLLTNNGGERLEPRNIVAFTFTNKAAAELKERITQRAKEAGDAELVGMAEMYVGTIHGFCQNLLQTEAPEYLKYEALGSIRQNLYVNRKSAKTGLTTSTRLCGKELRRWINTDLYISALNVLREDDVNERQLEGCSVAGGLRKYRAQLKEDAYFDFSSMMESAVRELKENSQLREQVAARIKYVIVDEYQDVNPIQERLIRTLYELGAELCVVGDDDQTIYQWRGSSVENILKFEDNYSQVSQITLEENFRSSEGVIETARMFINKVAPRLQKSMKYAKAQPYEAGDIAALHFDSPEDEAQHIVETIKSLYGVAFDDGDGERGLSWSDMAILLRSVKHNGMIITEALKEADIPFIVTGLPNLFETDEARAARDLFRYIAGVAIGRGDEPPTERQLRQAWENPRLGVGRSGLEESLRYVKSVRDVLRTGHRNPPSIQAVFLKFLELAELREEKIPEPLGQTVLFNLGRFSQAITDWEAINFTLKPEEMYEGFAKFLYYQADRAYSEGEEDNDYIAPDAVQVMTVHQAKGREWPVVFLPALLRNRFPAPDRKSQIWKLIPAEAVENADRYNGSTNDERRLFYVAMTRSKKFLHMTWAPIEGKNNWYVRKSEFWDDVLVSKWVKRRKPDYSKRRHAVPKARISVSNVEFSFSDLKYLFECSYQFKLRVLYGFNSPLVGALGYGKSLHDALAEVHYRAMRGEFATEADVPELVSRHLRTPYAYGAVRERLKNAAHRDIGNYIRDNTDKFQYIEFSEQPVEIQLGDGVSVRGRIDLTRRTDTGETSIVDLKSNEGSQAEDVSDMQLHTYALGYKELTGRDPDYVEIYELEGRAPKPRSVDEDFIDDVRSKTRQAATALRKMDLPPEPAARKCRRCDFSSLCSASLA